MQNNELKKMCYRHIRQIIILFAVINPLFLFCWVIISNFASWSIFLAVFILFVQAVSSLYACLNMKDVHNWLYYETYIWFQFSLIFLLLGFSGFVSKIPQWYVGYLFILFYVVSYLPWYKFLKKVWYSTYDANIKSGKFDLTRGYYSIIHQPAVYKFKNKVVNEWLGVMVANSAIIIGISAYYGIMVNRRANNPEYVLGVGAIVAAFLIAFVVTEKYINLKWVIKWEKENHKKMQTAYL